MSGWHYPDDSSYGPWDGPQYEPDGPDPSEYYDGEFDHPTGVSAEDSARHPHVDEIETSSPDFGGWRSSYEQPGEPGPGEEAWHEKQDELADDDLGTNWGPPPGDHDTEPPELPEVDDWPDPDHGREDHHYAATPDDDEWDNPAFDDDPGENAWEAQRGAEEHRVGAILTQAQQWPHRMAGGYGTGKTEDELAASGHGMQHHDKIQIMKGKDTGLYGEDEDHPQDIVGRPNDHGGFDVLRHLN